MDLTLFLDRIRHVVSVSGQGPCSGKAVPELLTRANPILGDRSIIDVLWVDGEAGWKKVEKLVDDSVIVYQDDRGDKMPIWSERQMVGPQATFSLGLRSVELLRKAVGRLDADEASETEHLGIVEAFDGFLAKGRPE